MSKSGPFTITKCRNAKNRWNIHIRQSLDQPSIRRSMEALNFCLVARAPTILVYDNEKIRVTFHKDGLIQIDSLTDTFTEAGIESMVFSILNPSKDRFDSF